MFPDGKPAGHALASRAWTTERSGTIDRETAIACRGPTKRYGAALAVDALDLEVAEGAVFGFLGPNGAGKTTTLRMLLGLIRPSAGTAMLSGRTMPDPRGLASVGAMIEAPALYPWLSGRDNLRVLAGAGPPSRRAWWMPPRSGAGSHPRETRRSERTPRACGSDWDWRRR